MKHLIVLERRWQQAKLNGNPTSSMYHVRIACTTYLRTFGINFFASRRPGRIVRKHRTKLTPTSYAETKKKTVPGSNEVPPDGLL